MFAKPSPISNQAASLRSIEDQDTGTNSARSHPPFVIRHSSFIIPPCGFALVPVLAVVALVTILVLAFLSLARTERRSSSAYAAGSDTRLLADLPMNLVIAQLRKATETLGNTKTWASQPGAIRVFGTTGESATGRATLEQIYKLYSAPRMVEGATFDPDAELPPTEWAAQPGVFADINAPVWTDRDHDGVMDAEELVFPILDPRGAAPSATDPKQPGIEGFELGTEVSGVVRPANASDTNARAPMPVRWLYVLKDGTLIAPTAQSGGKTSFAGAASPTTSNPITGRVAFWTDDETCKVNINTACEAVPWDTPRTNISTDAYLFANKQPVRGEYTRYPGHPATTCLSPILRPWLPLGDYPLEITAPMFVSANDPPPDENASALKAYRDQAAHYLALSPRNFTGGSASGTRDVSMKTPAVPRDQERLYATVDELFFDPARQRQPQGAGVAPLPASALEQTKFFLTAQSRAPEVTLYNTPRLALWPLMQDARDRNAMDQLIAFCTETRGGGTARSYHFQRACAHDLTKPALLSSYGSSLSPTEDMTLARNQQLHSWLQRLTALPPPGFASATGSFENKYPQDRDQILTEMIDYIRSGVNTENFWAAVFDSTGKDDFKTARDARGYSFSPPGAIETGMMEYGYGQVVPLRIGDTQGFGRCVTVTEAALVFYPTAPRWKDGKEGEPYAPDIQVSVPGDADRPAFAAATMRAFLLLEFFCASPGFPSWTPYLNVEIEGLDGLSMKTGAKLGFASGKLPLTMHTPVSYILHSSSEIGYGTSTSHFAMFQPFFRDGRSAPTKDAPLQPRRDVFSADPVRGYAWHSQSDVKLDAPSGAKLTPLDFAGGKITIRIRTPDAKEEIQSIALYFQPCAMPAPHIYIRGETISADREYLPDENEYSLPKRIDRNTAEYATMLIRPGDVVRSMEADGNATPKGDLRFYAARREVPAEWFTEGGSHGAAGTARPQWDYHNPEARFAHGLRHGSYWQYAGHFASEWSAENPDDAYGGEFAGTRSVHPYYRAASATIGGSLLSCVVKNPTDGSRQINLYRDAAPVTARGVTAALRADGRPGDWDNGIGNLEDGAYINRPDAANASTSVKANWAPYANFGGYYSRGLHSLRGDISITHAPNRQIASAVSFGSLPTGVMSEQPWQTLLFCPNPPGRVTEAFKSNVVQQPTAKDHPGFAFPRDHLLADFFWMPVVEPYAISEPFSTAGKVNLNYDILPFRHIKRRTALHAVLKSTWLNALPARFAATGDAKTNLGCYKGGRDQPSKEAHYAIDPDAVNGTLAAFEDRFHREKDVFRSATEICEVFLKPRHLPGRKTDDYPEEGRALPKLDEIMKWWSGTSADSIDGMKLTGDNSREAPYAQLLPRLTTKSNTFTVHYRVESLQKARSTEAAEWDEARDTVRGSQRGSVLIERYIDPNDPALPDFATDTTQVAVDAFYRVRVLGRKIFAP